MADLKVNITTTADLSGTQAAEQALQNVTAAAGQLAQASETASVAQSKASDAIDKSAVEADKLTGSFKETLPQAQKVADALKEIEKAAEQNAGNAKWLNSTAEALNGSASAANNVASAARAAGGPIRNLQSAYVDLKRAQQGGVEGVLSTVLATEKFAEAFGRIKGLLGSINPVILALSALTTGFALLKDKIVEVLNNTRANDRATADLTARANALKATYASLATAAKASLATQLEDLNKIKSAFDEIGQKADFARGRIKDLNSAQNELKNAQTESQQATALSGATTDEQKEAIRRRFSRTEAEDQSKAKNDELIARKNAAEIDVNRGTEQLRSVKDSQDTSGNALRLAQQRADDAKSRLQDLDSRGVSSDSGLGRDARDQAKEANKQLELAQENFKKVSEDAQTASKNAQDLINSATKALEIISIQQKTQAAQDQTRLTNQKTEDKATADTFKKRIDEQAKKAEDAYQSGDTEGQASAVSERNKILKEQKDFNSTVTERGPVEKPSRGQSVTAPSSSAKDDTLGIKAGTDEVQSALKTNNDKIVEVQKTNNTELKNVAGTINGLPVPPKIDINPLHNSIIEYNGKIITLQKSTQSDLSDLRKTVDLQSQQIDALMRAQSQGT